MSVDYSRGSQLNWATLTKEAYAIYMSVKKLSFYIDTAKITVKNNHLPLKKFLEKNTSKFQSKQLGSQTGVTKHNIQVHSRNLEYSSRYFI